MPNNKTEKRMGPQNLSKTAKRLLLYIADKRKFPLVLVVVCILISSLASVAGSLFLRILIDEHITPLLGTPHPDFSGLSRAVFAMAAIYLIGIIATYIYNYFMVVIAEGTLRQVRDGMFAHMQKLPLKYFDGNKYGDVMSRFTNDTDTLRQMITQSLPQAFSSAVTIVAVFAAMLATSLYLTAAVILSVTLMFFVIKMIAGNSAKYFVRQQASLGRINGYIEEMVNGQKIVKIFNHEEKAKAGFDLLNEELCRNSTGANRFANILMPVMINMGNLHYVLVAVTGGFLAFNGIGGTTLGMIASFMQLSRIFTMPIGQVSQQLNSVLMALAGAERIFKIMDEETEADTGSVTLTNVKQKNGRLIETMGHTGTWAWKQPRTGGTYGYTELKGEVIFHGVSFSYDGVKTVLHDIDLCAKPGQKIALVGATGAGKTTIANLINRFYDIDDGKVSYDGIDINKIKKSDLRRSLGIVLQDTNLFTGTVRENIRYGRLDATDDEVIAAAKQANAHDFISMLPQGYDTVLAGGGADLSQGQRQLLAIARAEAADAPVMILDEATSSIDTRTEAIVQAGMDALMRGRTVFVIAHRLSTVRDADVILVLENGRIIERGTHDELIAQKGKYYQLYTGAFELE